MLILEHNVLEVILRAFMDQLQPFQNGKFGFNNYCFCTGLSQELMMLNLLPRASHLTALGMRLDDAMYMYQF